MYDPRPLNSDLFYIIKDGPVNNFNVNESHALYTGLTKTYSSHAWETGIRLILASCRNCNTCFLKLWICDILNTAWNYFKTNPIYFNEEIAREEKQQQKLRNNIKLRWWWASSFYFFFLLKGTSDVRETNFHQRNLSVNHPTKPNENKQTCSRI